MKYPIMLMHGYGGWGQELPFGIMFNYFRWVTAYLRFNGIKAYAPTVDAFGMIEVRAEAWSKDLRKILNRNGNSKAHLVGHSQGGVDARCLVATYPELADHVASVTTISSPHYGTLLAEAMDDETTFGNECLEVIADLIADLGFPKETMLQLSPRKMAEFNERTPDVPGMPYFNYSTNGVNTIQPILRQLHDVLADLQRQKGEAPDNDGIVPTAGCHMPGHVDRGILNADHAEVIGHFVGTCRFKHFDFYMGIAKFLEEQEG